MTLAPTRATVRRTGAPSTLAVGAEVVRQALGERRTTVAVFSAVMIGMSLMVGGMWPSMQDTLAEMAEVLPPAFDAMMAGADLGTATGWVNAELFSMVAPGCLIAVAIISAVRSTAGEEDSKTLGMLLGAPVGRSTFLAAKAVAMLLHVALVGVAAVVGLLLADLVGGLGLDLGGILSLVLHTCLLAALFGAVALALGAGTGSRRIAYAGAAGLATAAFLAAGFLPLVDSLAGGAELSPWSWFNSTDPLVNGVDPAHAALLAGFTAAVLLLAVLGFRRRDLTG